MFDFSFNDSSCRHLFRQLTVEAAGSGVVEIADFSDDEDDLEASSCDAIFRQMTAGLSEQCIYGMAAKSIRAVEASTPWKRSAAWAVCEAAWSKALRKSEDALLSCEHLASWEEIAQKQECDSTMDSSAPKPLPSISSGKVAVPQPISDLFGLGTAAELDVDVAHKVLALGRTALFLRAEACALAVKTVSSDGKAACWAACHAAWTAVYDMEGQWPADMPVPIIVASDKGCQSLADTKEEYMKEAPPRTPPPRSTQGQTSPPSSLDTASTRTPGSAAPAVRHWPATHTHTRVSGVRGLGSRSGSLEPKGLGSRSGSLEPRKLPLERREVRKKLVAQARPCSWAPALVPSTVVG
ncbi:unnamed protein product [Polarella glacialis]|uniref:Uncharacterized protein n=1 Tax=Polarella glacialis TaxID=89957 RepID=A0A813HIE8_POLGL|nr:unnamed protein product [Polarella glacialis]